MPGEGTLQGTLCLEGAFQGTLKGGVANGTVEQSCGVPYDAHGALEGICSGLYEDESLLPQLPRAVCSACKCQVL